MRKAAILAIATVATTLLAPVAPVSAATTTYQAENATIFHGVVESNHVGFTGSGFVNYTNEVGSWVQWSVNVAAAGSVSLAFRFANGTTASRPMTIAVDGATVSTPSFPGTGAWTSWTTTTVSTNLAVGSHTVRAAAKIGRAHV